MERGERSLKREFYYKERSILKVIVVLFLVGGNLFFLWASIDILKAGEYIGLVLVLLFDLGWSLYFRYIFVNTPCSLWLTREGVKIEWSKTRIQQYQWEDVRLTTFGLNPKPVLTVNDNKWPFRLYTRIVWLNGWLRSYKELIIHIKEFKQLYSDPPNDIT